MTDDQDRTVFKQPMPGGERTSMRPSPGRRSTNRPPPPNGGGFGGASPPPPRPPAGGGRGGFEQSKFNTSIGLNPLVNAASTLIAVFEKTHHTIRHSDVGGLHKNLLHEVKAFEQKAKEAGVRPEIVLSARYLLCSALDEAVMHTPWGGESAWGQRSLLSVYHGETSGGEKCFLILDKMLQAPAENLHMLELFYTCISLGFEGKYRLDSRGRDQLEALRDDLYRAIRTYRGDFEHSLSLSWQGLGRGRKTLSHYVPTWVAASIFAAIIFMGYGGFSYWMRSESRPIIEKLDIIAGQVKAPKKVTTTPMDSK